mmetsp:Transcript_35693/g.95746  ORF Transcript_35693/g.95746 Transcript_35693/m.95746 type:complete len:231 (+) Transcript_35693:328-1020(+)
METRASSAAAEKTTTALPVCLKSWGIHRSERELKPSPMACATAPTVRHASLATCERRSTMCAPITSCMPLRPLPNPSNCSPPPSASAWMRWSAATRSCQSSTDLVRSATTPSSSRPISASVYTRCGSSAGTSAAEGAAAGGATGAAARPGPHRPAWLRTLPSATPLLGAFSLLASRTEPKHWRSSLRWPARAPLSLSCSRRPSPPAESVPSCTMMACIATSASTALARTM